jgi:hypothetical protein
MSKPILRCLTVIALGTLVPLVGCDKKEDAAPAPAASTQAPSPSASGAERRGPEHEHEHEGDGGRRERPPQ